MVFNAGSASPKPAAQRSYSRCRSVRPCWRWDRCSIARSVASADRVRQLQGEASEPLVMQIANQVAAELNAATGSTYSANRDNHEHTNLYNSTSPTSTTYSIARPGCG